MRDLEEHVQLEFPLTRVGYLQQRAILQDLFLQDCYKMYVNESEDLPLPIKSFEDYLNEDGLFWMKQYSKLAPIDFNYYKTLL